MPSFTVFVEEHDVRVDAAAFFAYAAAARGRHTGWLREIGEAHAGARTPRFSFRIFEGSKLAGYETNPELHVVLKAIEAHLVRSKKRESGSAVLRGETDALPRSIMLDYFRGTLTFMYPVWHMIDLSSVELPTPRAQPGGELEAGIAYVLKKSAKKRRFASGELVAAGVSGTSLYVGYPDWMKRKGRTSRYASRRDAMKALEDFVREREKREVAARRLDDAAKRHPLVRGRSRQSGAWNGPNAPPARRGFRSAEALRITICDTHDATCEQA
jgi:hypothetical protein